MINLLNNWMQKYPFYLILLLLLPISVHSQVVTGLEMVNDSLGQSENFQFTYTFYNGSDELLQYGGSSSWQVKLAFSDIDEFDNAITADHNSYFIGPGDFLTFEFDLSPEELLWPLFDGEHKIYATFMGHTDSVTVKAPAFYGGEIWVKYDTVKTDTVHAFKDSLVAEDASMEIVDHGENSGIVHELWSFDHLQVERLNQQIKKGDRFMDSWIDRFITHESTTHTANESQSGTVPEKTELKQNYPNPFNPTTNIEFYLNQPGRAELSVYDLSGRKVAELVSSPLPAGNHTQLFNASNLASGIYIYRLNTEYSTNSKKLTLIK